jgi:hypothetical protein
VKYEVGFYITEDILPSHRRESLKFYKVKLDRVFPTNDLGRDAVAVTGYDL